MPELDDPDGMKRAGEKKMPKVPKQKVKEACNESKGGVDVQYTELKSAHDI